MRLETQTSKNIADTTFKVPLESYKIDVSVCSVTGKPGLISTGLCVIVSYVYYRNS